MMLQNDIGLIDIIRRIGCYYLALARMVELESGYDFKPDELNTIWLESKSYHYIDWRNNIIKPDEILSLLVRITDKKIKLAQVGQTQDGKTLFWQWYQGNAYDYGCKMLNTGGQVGTHWVLVDTAGNLLYDSYSFKDYEYTDSGRTVLYARL